MSSVDKKQVISLLRQTGSYLCPHYQLDRTIGEKKGCCGRSHQFEYAPMCKLANGSCYGLSQCPRLDMTTKSNLIQQWSQDLRTRKIIDPTQFMVDI